MTTIAIVSEGITDQIFLEELIFKCVRFEDEPEFVYAQPARDETHKHNAPHGGWELVFEYCETRILDAVETNDFTIIQVDTDCGDHANFRLDISPGGVHKDDETLVRDATTIVRSKIDPTILAEHGHKLIFAITVHSSEAWILLCLFNDCKKKNALHHLKRQKGMRGLTKTAASYGQIMTLLKPKNCKPHLNGSDSLALFISDFVAKHQDCSTI